MVKLHYELDADWLRSDEHEFLAIIKEIGIIVSFKEGQNRESRIKDAIDGYISTVGKESFDKQIQEYQEENIEFEYSPS